MDNNYYDFTSKEVLNNSTLIRNSGVPLAVSITPFIYEKDPSVPFFDTKLRSLCQCGQAIDNIDLNDEEYYCICDTHIDIDDDILLNSANDIETIVKLGEKIGRKC